MHRTFINGWTVLFGWYEVWRKRSTVCILILELPRDFWKFISHFKWHSRIILWDMISIYLHNTKVTNISTTFKRQWCKFSKSIHNYRVFDYPYKIINILSYLNDFIYIFTIHLYCWLCFVIPSLTCSYLVCLMAWWRHQMETFSALLAICAGNSPVPGEFPSPVTRSFDIFFDLRKQ